MGLAPEQLKYRVVEDVDDHPQGARFTFEDDLVLLSGPGNDGTWGRELPKLLQAEQRERDEIQRLRVARVRDWQQTITSHKTAFDLHRLYINPQ